MPIITINFLINLLSSFSSNNDLVPKYNNTVEITLQNPEKGVVSFDTDELIIFNKLTTEAITTGTLAIIIVLKVVTKFYLFLVFNK